MNATATDCSSATTAPAVPHPCFDAAAHRTHARVHLPVAPRCNLQCNFCNRKFDCMNESRPGVTSAVLTPDRAVDYLDVIKERVPNLTVVGIAGPGDPFANCEETMATLEGVKRRHPELLLCLASNGLGIGPHIDDLHRLGVSHVTITVNAIDPVIGSRIYAWVRDGKRPMRGVEAAGLLLERQLSAISRMKALGMTVKVNSIIIPGINETHIEAIAEKMGQLKVDRMNCMAFLPVAGAEFENLPEPNAKLVAGLRFRAERHLPQMTHCARCRADAVGLIHEGMTAENHALLQAHALPAARQERPYVAVASEEGMLVNQHLGEASRVMVFGPDPLGGYKVEALRKLPEMGGGDDRWKELADTLSDCRAILVSACGPRPKKLLSDYGLPVVEMEGLIEEGLNALFAGEDIPSMLKRRFTSCGTGCKGTGTGCG